MSNPESPTGLVVKWSVIRRDGETFVVEVFGTQTVEYGPMPPDAAGPLIDERKEFYEDAVGRFGKRNAP